MSELLALLSEEEQARLLKMRAVLIGWQEEEEPEAPRGPGHVAESQPEA